MESIEALDGHYKGRDIYIVGTGTSLIGFDWSSLEGKITIALNDAAFAFDSTYHLYTDNIGERYRKLKRNTVIFKRIYADKSDNPYPCRRAFWFHKSKELHSCGKDRLYVFGTVAATAIHLCYRMKARRVFLLGVDCYRLENGERYFDRKFKKNAKKYKPIHKEEDRITEKQHRRWFKAMRDLRSFFDTKNVYRGPYPKEGIYNMNPLSRLETWEKI